MSEQYYDPSQERPTPQQGPYGEQTAYQGQPYQGVPPHDSTYHHGGYNEAYRRPPLPKTYLVESILMIILCCLPLGIVSLIKGQEANSLYQSGHYEAAEAASASAKKWLLWGLGIGLGGVLLYVIGYIVVIAMALATS